MARAAPSAAPPDTPTRPGSAKGLRNNPCIATPDNASTDPTAMPSKLRGRRICPRINSACCVSPPSSGNPSRRIPPSKVSPRGRLTGPRARDSQNTSTSNSSKKINVGRGRKMAVMS
ncbi:hypothetical protein D3C86_1560520 [compost metagenome]